jgi:histone acetyltransferase 1
VSATQANFKNHDRHLQALLKFYIEGASFILVDGLWHYFLVYIDNKLAAYATTYEEYRKVPKAPVTISQVLVLPPYQRLGIGSELLRIMYACYLNDRKCTLITVEDPATDFQRMKDGLDTKLILQHGFFFSIRQALKKNGRRNFLQPELLKECTLDHIEIGQIRNKLKLAKNNIQRCFEFVLICLLDPKDPNAHENYRRGILKRMAECRTLLRPYFRYENFADRSMYNDNLLGGDDEIEREVAMMRENCCNGEGELNCFKEENDDEEMSPASLGQR